MKRVKDGIAASLTILKADEMTDEGRKAIAEWLRECAKNLVKNGKNYSKRFKATYRI